MYVYELSENNMNLEFIRRRFKVNKLDGIIKSIAAETADDWYQNDLKVLKLVQMIQISVDLFVYDISKNYTAGDSLTSLIRSYNCLVYIHFVKRKVSADSELHTDNSALFERLNQYLELNLDRNIFKREVKTLNEASNLPVVNIIPDSLFKSTDTQSIMFEFKLTKQVESERDALHLDP